MGDNVEWAAKQKKANKHAPHELAFFRVSGRMRRTGFFDGWRGLLSVLGFVMSVAFVTVPFFRFDTIGRKLLFALGPYVVTSASGRIRPRTSSSTRPGRHWTTGARPSSGASRRAG